MPADPSTSKEAAAAAAAAAVLATIDPKTAGEMKVALATYLASIPDGAAKSGGVKLAQNNPPVVSGKPWIGGARKPVLSRF
jgi:hypothetical protein